MSHHLIQSHVWHGDKCFCVSTINRQSSAALAFHNQYAETMVWDFDLEAKQNGELLGQAEGPRDDISIHLDICRKLRATGRMEDEQTS